MGTRVRIDEDEVARRIERFKAVARIKGLKLTHQRLEIFREVAASLEHPDAESVHRAVSARLPTVSLDTVYRTLRALGDLGLISTLGARRENVRFDANLVPHHHFVCVRCGLTRDFEAVAFHALRPPASVKRLGSVVSTHIEARGVCDACGTKKDGRRSNLDRKPEGRKGRRR